MLDWDVPPKKWVKSPVKEIEVTLPMSSLPERMIMFWIEILANLPSPVPTTKSPLGSSLTIETPRLNSLLTGPTLLYMAFSMLTSKMSPVLVPQ